MTDLELAAVAHHEVEARERRYPALVDQGTMERGAALADIAAWRRILAWLATGEVPIGRRDAQTPALLWTPLEAAARAGIERGDKACARHPHDRDMRHRRDAVAAIHARLARLVDAFETPRAEEAAA